jgi:hypothetical protein
MVKDDKKLTDWRLDVFDFEPLEALGLKPERHWEGQRVRANFENGDLAHVQIGA